MNILKIAKHLIIIIILVFSLNSCTEESNNMMDSNPSGNNGLCIYLNGNSLEYYSDIPIAGFQFNHNGCVSNASGGDASSNGFSISSSESAVVGFSLMGNVIPAGSGVLLQLDGVVTSNCLSNFVFSDANGVEIDFEINTSPCQSLSVMTWNIENFPKSGLLTIDHVVSTIAKYNPDIVALQEMPDNINHDGLSLLREALSDYSFIFDQNSFISLAFFYKESSLLEYVDHFDMVNSLNIDQFNGMNIDDMFLRHPLTLHMKWHDEDLFIVNNHLKCCGDGIIQTELLYECDETEHRYLTSSECSTNCSMGDCFSTYDEEYRRLLASQFMETHLNVDDKIIMLGDLNDELTDDQVDNVFWDLLASDDFIFTDMSISEGNSDYWSFPSYPSHIDHIMITSPLESSFNKPESSIDVLAVDLEFMNWDEYDFLVSDHRPVLIKFAY